MHKKTFKLTSLLGTMAFLCLASVSASAGMINFSFTSDGLLGGLDNACGANCVLLKSAGIASDTSGSGESWLFQGTMKIYEGSQDVGSGSGPGLGWSFTDLDGVNSLFGTFSAKGDLLNWSGSGQVDYDVLGGSGLFAGALGSGTSTIWTSVADIFGIYIGAFHEEGLMSVSTSVPEPGQTTLLLAALGMLGYMGWRRRAAAKL